MANTEQQVDRLLVLANHALSVRQLERVQTAMHRGECENYEESRDASDGYAPGSPRCRWEDPDPCPSCRLREADHRHVAPMIKAARACLRRTADKILREVAGG